MAPQYRTRLKTCHILSVVGCLSAFACILGSRYRRYCRLEYLCEGEFFAKAHNRKKMIAYNLNGYLRNTAYECLQNFRSQKFASEVPNIFQHKYFSLY